MHSFIVAGTISFFAELLSLRPRHNTQQLHVSLGLFMSNVSFTAKKYIDSLLLVAKQLAESCGRAPVCCIELLSEIKAGA